MHSTLSENVEGSPFKQDLDRCEMFSSWTEGPFLKMGNVVFGAGPQLKSDVQNTSQAGDTSDSPHMIPTTSSITNITDNSDRPLTIQYGGGQATPTPKQGGRTASKSRSNPKKRTSKPKKKTSKKTKGKNKTKSKSSKAKSKTSQKKKKTKTINSI